MKKKTTELNDELRPEYDLKVPAEGRRARQVCKEIPRGDEFLFCSSRMLPKPSRMRK